MTAPAYARRLTAALGALLLSTLVLSPYDFARMAGTVLGTVATQSAPG